MYNEFFGLTKAPFNLTPDPEFLYLTEHHREALAGLTYAILARKGFVVLTGNAGTGKTTLVTRILGHLPASRIQTSVVVNPTLTPAEFLEAVLLDLGLEDVPASKAQRIAKLQKLLWEGNRAGKITALIVDEAHKLSLDLIEEIRLLGNFESASEKLLQIVLVGQSELDELLNRESLRQFKQRIAVRLTIAPLAGTEIEEYIQYRWTKAGGGEAPFSSDARAHIGQASQGIPRVVNVICDNALMLAFGEDSKAVEVRHVRDACRELQFGEPLPKSSPEAVSPAPVAVAVSTPVPVPIPVPITMPALDYFPIRTLARYEIAAARPSLLARLAGKLKFTQRIEE